MLDEKDLQYLAEMEKRIDARMTEMADEARRGAVHDMQVIIENTIMPSLKLLAEGQRTLLETMAPKTRVEELEDDMQLLKAVVRSQSERGSMRSKNGSPEKIPPIQIDEQRPICPAVRQMGAFCCPDGLF